MRRVTRDVVKLELSSPTKETLYQVVALRVEPIASCALASTSILAQRHQKTQQCDPSILYMVQRFCSLLRFFIGKAKSELRVGG